MNLSTSKLAGLIDHTLLKPEADESSIRTLCEEAGRFKFHAVCVNPYWTTYCAELLEESKVVVCTVIGFPLGATTTSVKRREAEEAIGNGATELDMVMSIGALKSGFHQLVENDIRGVVDAAAPKRALVKVILETSLLTYEEKLIACEIAQDAGANFVKTSTGFGPGGASTEDVALLKKHARRGIGIKAAGGIRTYRDALEMIEAGASRLGTSNSLRLVAEAQEQDEPTQKAGPASTQPQAS